MSPKLKLLREVISNIFSRPATIQYPREPAAVSSEYRGLHYPDLNKCIGCSLCMVDCPANAIKMVKLPSDYKNPKNPKGIYPVVDYGKCVFCYQCVFVCPVKAYITSNKFDMTDYVTHNSQALSLKTIGRGEKE